MINMLIVKQQAHYSAVAVLPTNGHYIAYSSSLQQQGEEKSDLEMAEEKKLPNVLSEFFLLNAIKIINYYK